jgi:hypothetical protein
VHGTLPVKRAVSFVGCPRRDSPRGDGTLQFPEHNVSCLAGFSDKTMELLATLDTGPRALIKAIEAVAP